MRPIVHSALAASLWLLPAGVTGQEPPSPTTGTPAVSLAIAPPQTPRIDAVVMSIEAEPTVTADTELPADRAHEPHWSGRYFRCPSLTNARRVLAAVAGHRRRNAEAADPAFRRAIAVERCRLLPDHYEEAVREGYADSEMEGADGFEFEEDGQSVQLMSVKDRLGAPVALIYAQGAC